MTTIQQVELGVLGTLQVRQYGLPVAIPGAKPRSILTMLGLYGGSAVSADMLVELLWGDNPPRTAAKALQTHISALRRTLGDGFVLTEGTGWTVRTTEIDATRYRAAVRLGRDAIAAGDVGQAVARFDEALSLWRGTPELPDSARGTSEKTRWVEGHDALVEDRADALLATGRAAEIVGELEAAVADAPLRERRWGQLMLALYRAGRQGEALGAYQRARSLLAEELGVDPGPDLRRLEAAIVAQDDALELPVAQQFSAVTRAVTFLLTDIEGSTAAWEADAEAMAVALARHDELVEQVVTSRGGRLIKTRGEGDATFSVFDRPSAAVAAAIELQEAIRHEPWALAEPMRIRVALHTGEVELRGGDYFGRAVNRAARLRSLALGGQILCSGATAELVIDTLSDDVFLVDLGSRQLKNLARPEHVFELRLDTADAQEAHTADVPPIERPELPAVLAGTGPFVGRALELERLLSAWESTMEAGARAVLIAGEPGVGKTRLAGEWSRQAYEQGAVVLYGRCDEDLGVPYQPFAEALRSLVPCLGADRLRGMRGIESLLSMVPGLTDVLPDLAGPARADADTDRYALFDAVVALLGVASTSAPVVLILDDLHWAAKPTLLLLRHLLRFGEHARVQIVGTYRSTDLDRSHPLAAMLADLHRDGTAHRLQLDGLDEDDVTAYVTEAGYDDEELARALSAVTGGNPFFLIEALRHVDESGGRWDPSTLPQGVREAVSRRLSRLPVQTNKALAAAAVVGSRFAVDLVERVVEQDLIDAFDEACQAGIIIEEPGGRYRFNHALVRQSLLAELASVRRMRLHQRIAVTLENEPGADDELLSELAHHYFECAWAGNAAKAVDYCRRAADQAMARLAYEGAAELYDRALHALEELDDELPDRDALQAELLLARCEALLAAGDVGSAAGAVAQLQQAAGDSVRLTAWGTCFEGELSMLTNPERLDEIEAAVGAAAEELAALEDAAGEAKAHTVRASCLARLGRIGDAETALDQALTAARRAHDHRRVNAVLAGAPLAALWGPNPVPRAGGRCLDVVRLLRITTGSPVVEATSTRCQGVLDALRGRAAAGRALIDSARRSLTELGMRHALLEVEQFAGIVELVANEPAAAEPLLRRACDGFRRMGLDADTAETAAFLARACLALERDAEADELCIESERLAGHALKPSITWRTVRAQLLARSGAHAEARRVAEEAVSIAERTDALVDHGDACLTLAVVLKMAGDVAGARAAADQAVALFERKGAAALAELTRSIVGAETAEVRSAPETPVIEAENECVRTLRRVDAAVQSATWDEVVREYAPAGSIESRQKIVGFGKRDYSPREMVDQTQKLSRGLGAGRLRREAVALRGERLALTTLKVGTADTSAGAPQVEMLQLVSLDDQSRIALQIWFDIDDMDAAIAELDALHAGTELDTACVRLIRRLDAAYDRDAWEEIAQCIAGVVSVESRRKIVGVDRADNTQSEWLDAARHYRQTLAQTRYRHTVLAARGERLALTSLEIGLDDQSPGAPRDALLQLYGLDEAGQLALHVHFDIDDLDAAMAELDLHFAQFELDNACVRAIHRLDAVLDGNAWDDVKQLLSSTVSVESRRSIVGMQPTDLPADEWIRGARSYREVAAHPQNSAILAVRGERFALTRVRIDTTDRSPGAPRDDMLMIWGLDERGFIAMQVWFDIEDMDAAIAELDALHGRFELDNVCVRTVRRMEAVIDREDWDEFFRMYSPDVVVESHRQIVGFSPADIPSTDWPRETKRLLDVGGSHRIEFIAVRGERFALARLELGTPDTSPGAPVDESLLLVGLDSQGRIALQVSFEVGDADSAMAELDAQHARLESDISLASAIENACVRTLRDVGAVIDSGSWDAVEQFFAPITSVESRRKLVGFGRIELPARKWPREIRRYLEDMKPRDHSVLAMRGERLALIRLSMRAEDLSPGSPQDSVLWLVSIDQANLIDAQMWFDVEDLDAAIAELDARYLAGEASAHAQVWRCVLDTLDEANRHEPGPILSRLEYTDHQRVSFGSADFGRAVEELWVLVPDARYRATSVHALDAHGTVASLVIEGRDSTGNELQWHGIVLLLPDESRMEVFGDDDLPAALARFEELSGPAHRLDNTANRVLESYLSHYAARDWDAMAPTLAEDFWADDRRRVVNAGLRHGRDNEISSLKAMVEIGCANITTEPVAIRGDRLVLARHSFIAPDWPELDVETVDVVEINSDGQIIAEILYEADDLDAAFAELDARYLAGEAAAHADSWSLISQTFAAANRHQLPPTTPDWVNIDHRRVTTIEAGDPTESFSAAYDVVPDLRVYIEAVHRLSDLGGVVIYMARGSSKNGFGAEWREIALMFIEGDKFSRNELFDCPDLDFALARFDELSRSKPAPENDATRVSARFDALFNSRDWSVLTELYAEDVSADDRRHVVSGGPRSGREAEIANLRAMADVAAARIDSTVLAIRGRRFGLFRSRISDDDVSVEGSFLSVLEVNADYRIAGVVGFDTDDVDAAFAELEARYIAGEAAAHAHVWSVISRAHDGLNRREIYATTPDWASIDHRPVAAFTPGDLIPYLRAAWVQIPDLSFRIDAVHRLTDEGAVYTSLLKGTSRESFDAEWQLAEVVLVKGELLSRVEIFDATDLDTAIARFEEVSRQPRRLENRATRVVERFNVCFAEHDWEGLATILADDVLDDDRRRVVNSGIQRGRDVQLANLQAIVDLGMGNYAPIVVATRGNRLALTRTQITSDEQSDMPALEPLTVAEINSDGQLSASVHFDYFEDAIAELDARYLAGEAAPHAHAWSNVTKAYALMNDHGLPGTTGDWVNIDHRRGATFASGDLSAFVEAAWADNEQDRLYVEAVHRLGDIGAVVTQVSKGTTRQGFDAEWRTINLYTFKGELFSRCEVFDEDDLDTAIARFEELSRPAMQLANAASRAIEPIRQFFAARDWNGVRGLLAENVVVDDRRRTVNAGIRRGRSATVDDLQAAAAVGFTHVKWVDVATRGERLALRRSRFSGQQPEVFHVEALHVLEIGADEKVTKVVIFDADDIDAAFAELDARYIAGEAAAHTQTWMVIARNLSAFNRGERTTTTPDWVTIDHRKVARFAPGELRAAVLDAVGPTQELRSRNVAVHRLSDRGAVVTTASQGTSPQGFEAEWQVIQVLMIEGELISRCELFDESDLEAAIARFDELSRPPQRLQNHAVHVYERLWACFANRDWTTLADSLAENVISIDRRRVVNAGIRTGREVLIADICAAAEVGANIVTSTVKATRGDRLALCHLRSSNRGPMLEEFPAEMLGLVEIGADGRIVEHVTLDVDEVDAAFTELDKRYLAGEAAPHERVYSVIAEAFAAVNRRELPATTSDFVSIDHRRPVAFAPGQMMAYLQATLNDAPEIRIDIEAVHRLSSRGVVVSHMWHNTSQQGVDAEWRVIGISMIEGGLINRCELYDESDLDVALARFDELTGSPSRFANTASRVAERFRATFTARDWDSMAAMLADDLYNEDRRPVVNAGVRHGRDSLLQDMRSAADAGIPTLGSIDLATRGDRLVLVRAESSYEERPGAFFVENLAIAEIDADEKVTAQVVFGVDEVDAAFDELDKRYVAGEGAAYADTWSVIAGAYAALNRHEIPPTTPDWVNIDHRRGGSTFATGDMATYIRASWEDSPQNKIRVETVHRLNHLGAVVTSATRGVSVAGFYAEWRQVDLVTVDGAMLSGTELFDEEDLELALARFDEITESASGVENAATRAWRRFSDVYNRRDMQGFLAVHDQNAYYEDRRKGLRDEGPIGQDVGRALLFEASPSWRLEVEPIAIRGEALALIRGRFRDMDEPGRPSAVEVLAVIEVADGDSISYEVFFDPDDIDAALAELDARYLAGEAAPHAQTWSVLAPIPGAFNRREFPVTTQDCINIDHRRGTAFSPGELTAYMRATWDMSPHAYVNIESVHRLTDFGAVVTHAAHAVSQDGFAAEWRVVNIYGVTGERISRCEIFDEDELDAALARFDELDVPAAQLENAATRGDGRAADAFNRGDLEGYLGVLAPNAQYDDRRRGLRNAGPIDREFARGLLFTGPSSWCVEIEPVAIRGRHLALVRHICRDTGEAGRPLVAEVLAVVEADDDELICRSVLFGAEEIAAAFEELDSVYLAGEAAQCGDTWSAIVRLYAGLNRHELPPWTADVIHLDHRTVATIDPNDLAETLHPAWDLASDFTVHIEIVHRLTDVGAVVTNRSYGTSKEGFDAEWRMTQVLTVARGRIDHFELYDEADIDAALARLDELSPSATLHENVATRGSAALAGAFNRHDLDGLVAAYGKNAEYEDRRKGLRNVGLLNHDFGSGLFEFEATSSWRLESEPIAIRGNDLALVRHTYRDTADADQPITVEALLLTETDDHGLICHSVLFDPEDIDAAFEELERRYLAGKPAQFADTWTVITRAYAGMTRGELPPTSSDLVNLDHRRVAPMAPDNGIAYLRASWDLAPGFNLHIEAVHRLSGRGAVFTRWSSGTSQDGFDAEWRAVDVITVKDGLINRGEIFDVVDLDSALALFDELAEPAHQFTTMASRVTQRVRALFVARDWDGLGDSLAENFSLDDRRHTVNGGLSHGRETIVRDLRTTTDIGFTDLKEDFVACRGEHLVLTRARYFGNDPRAEAFFVEVLHILEIDAHQKVCATVVFDPSDLDAALAELDARYLAAEAAAHPQIWSVIARTFAGLDRHEIPATIADSVHVDHRQIVTIESNDMLQTINAAWNLVPDLRMYIEEVHRLTSFGGVVTSRSYGTSRDGFDAEWRMLHVGTIAGELCTRFELFDEADLDAALARFDELSATAPQLENAATKSFVRITDAFNRRDVMAFLGAITGNARYEDRRKGLRNEGPVDANLVHAMLSKAADGWRLTIEPIAVRGRNLALSRYSYHDVNEADRPVALEAMVVTEVSEEHLSIVFDPDDTDAAFEELDARYLAGEAAEHAQTWSTIARGFAEFGNHELPQTAFEWIDHRTLVGSGISDLGETTRAVWDMTSDIRARIVAVHRLDDRGAVITHVLQGTSREGFDFELRLVDVISIVGHLINRCESFDESDLDAAIAIFDEFPSPAMRLENSASRARAHVCDTYNRRDVEEFLAIANGRYEDRRKGLQYEGPADRGYAAAVLSGTPTSWRLEYESVAIRGDRLALSHETFRDSADAELPITVELFALTDLSDELAPRVIFFDSDDIDAAFAELNARWIASGEVEHAAVIRSAQQIFDLANRHDWTTIADRLGEATYVSHRQLGLDDADMSGYLSSIRLWASLVPDLWGEVAEVLAHSAMGVVARLVLKGTSTDGTVVEVPTIHLVLLDGDRVTHLETYDPQQRDMALARFEELSSTASILDNAVTRVLARVVDSTNRRDVDSYLAIFTDDARYEDRRKGLRDAGPVKPDFARAVIDGAGTGWQVEVERIAARGPHLALCHLRYRDHDEADHPVVLEALFIVDVTVSESISVLLLFDPDDIDAAFADLDARWIASGECTHPEIIKAVQTFTEAANRHEWDELAARHAGATYTNHRQLRSGADTVADDISSLRMLTSLVPDLRFEATEFLRLSARGAVIQTVAKGISTEDVPIELPLVVLMLIDGDRVTHAETFDLNQREQALARFDELSAKAPQPANALARVLARVVDAFDRRDPDRYLALFSEDCMYEDRRKGLRDAGSVRPDYAQTVTFGAAAGWQAEFETIAVRGEHLMLGRATFRDQSETGSPIAVEALNIGSISDDELISWFAVLDPDDIDAAFAELTARWIASGEVAYPDVIEAALRSNEMYNRHDWDAIAANEFGATYVNHRQLVSAEPETIEDHWRSIRALASLIPDLRTEPVQILAHSAKGVVADLVVKGSTPGGAVIEFPAITLSLFDGTRVIHMEAFDVNQREQALARFDELNT